MKRCANISKSRLDSYAKSLTLKQIRSIMKDITSRDTMAKNAPGRHERNPLTFRDVVKMSDTEEKAEQWFVEAIWGDEIRCP